MSDPVSPPTTVSAIAHCLFCTELWIHFTSGRTMSNKKKRTDERQRCEKKTEKRISLSGRHVTKTGQLSL